MDLKNLMNDGPPPEKKTSTASPETQRSSLPQAPPGLAGTNGHALGLGGSSQPTPLYGPPSIDTRSASGSIPPNKGITPLRTPGQAHYGASYPFPSQQQPSQSAAQPSTGQQYGSYGGPYSAITPGGRPPSHSYPPVQQQPPTPSQYGPGGIPQGFRQPTSSHSPTPSSGHHSSQQTPHAMRQSPHAVLHQQPSPQHNPYSQPNTPLGPPPLNYQRSFTSQQYDMNSPLHQRTFSGASNGLPTQSPAQHHMGIPGMNDSPSAYSHQSPQHLRRTSDYLAHVERERSVSVSPKTKVPPRPSSLSSRHSSQQDIYSARSSMQVGTPGHVRPTPSFQQPPAPQYVAQHGPTAQSPYSAAPVTQTQPYQAQAPPTLSTQTSSASNEGYSSLSRQASAQAPSQQPPSLATQLSQAQQQQQPPPPQYQSQRMDMNSLLTPVSEHPPLALPSNGVNGGTMTPAAGIGPRKVKADPFAKPSPRPKQPAFVTAPPPEPTQLPRQPEVKPEVMESPALKPGQKRPAESELQPDRPVKIERRRKYTERPIWARLSPHNPRYYDGVNGMAASQRGQQQMKGQVAPPRPQQSQPNGAHPTRPMPQPNGQPVQVDGHDDQPWLQNPPLDQDLIAARRILGGWEKTFRWNTPMPSMLREVQKWLYQTLLLNQDVGHDPLEGTIEIEAKIGTLVNTETGQRIALPVTSATVLAEKFPRLGFESQMEEREHQTMNEFLNKAIRDSKQPGRVPMDYEHRYETDSFAALSPAGYDALPPSISKRHFDHPPKLRTSRNDKTGQVIARIIKMHLGSLHIFNPQEPYDCRISMNLEVNLDRPDLDPDELIEQATEAKPAPLSRKKDRLSYKHLAYSIDLTKVETRGFAPKYELELEVDSSLLREQMQRMQSGQEHAFTDVVSGFVDDATFLMRQRPAAG